MNNKIRQSIKSGDGSTTIQAGIVVMQTVDEAKIQEVSRKVMETEFAKLTDKANEMMLLRIDEMKVDLIGEIKKDSNFNIKKIEEPGFQFALNEAQKEFGISGEEGLKKGLVKLLIKIGKENDSRKERLYAEAIKIVPLLSKGQINALAIICATRYITSKPQNFNALLETLKNDVLTFVDDVATSGFSYSHMEYCRVGSISMGTFRYAERLVKTYPGAFMNGIKETELPEIITELSRKKLFIRNQHDTELLQVGCLDDETLEGRIKNEGIGSDEGSAIKAVFNRGKMDAQQVIKILVEKDERFVKLFKLLDETNLSKFPLSSVGLIIGIVEIENNNGGNIDISEILKD